MSEYLGRYCTRRYEYGVNNVIQYCLCLAQGFTLCYCYIVLHEKGIQINIILIFSRKPMFCVVTGMSSVSRFQ